MAKSRERQSKLVNEIGIGRKAPTEFISQTLTALRKTVPLHVQISVQREPALYLIDTAYLRHSRAEALRTKAGQRVSEHRVKAFLDELAEQQKVGRSFLEGILLGVSHLDLADFGPQRDGRVRYGLGFKVTDVETDEYPDGFQLQGEKKMLASALGAPSGNPAEVLIHTPPEYDLRIGTLVIPNGAQVNVLEIRHSIVNLVNGQVELLPPSPIGPISIPS